MRLHKRLKQKKALRPSNSPLLLAISAGQASMALLQLINDLKHRMHPIGFLDDNKKIHGRMIHGKEVFGKVADLVEHITAEQDHCWH